MGDTARDFGFPTLDAATAAARDLAAADHRRRFVVEVGDDQLQRPTFGTASVGDLEMLIYRAASGALRLAILRVVEAAGTVAGVADPGDLEGRLVAFCTSA